jgi:hypothetical protein
MEDQTNDYQLDESAHERELAVLSAGCAKLIRAEHRAGFQRIT